MSSSSSRRGHGSRDKDERQKVVQDRLQLLLTRMLKDEDNKYCVDCDAKGPRWASWNLGLFLCIRCAGIHRNLGVHISKVKSVNLDSWTPTQVASMQLMGNSRARAVYEANLPDGFMRPQSDQTLEQFIRAKYERKKYVAKEWVSQKPPDFPEGWYELVEAEKQKKDLRKVILPSHTGFGGGGTQQESRKNESDKASKSEEAAKAAVAPNRPKPQTPAAPVGGGLEKSPAAPVAAKPAPKSAEADLLGLDMGQPQSNGNADILGLGNAPSNQGGSGSNTNLFADAGSAPSGTASSDLAAPAAPVDKSKMTKDSIMALFNSAPPPAPQQQQQGVQQQQQNMFGGASNMFPTHNGAAAGNPSAFGVNPQSNPFLNSGVSQNATNSMLHNQQQKQQPQAFNQMQGVQAQFGGLNLGTNTFSGNMVPSVMSPPGSNNAAGGFGAFQQAAPPVQAQQPVPGAFASPQPAAAAATNSASQDILGLW